MAIYIDETFWWDSLGKPNWYTLLKSDFSRLEKLAKQHEGDPDRKQIKREAYEIVERAVREKHIPLADTGENFDADRRTIDTIVIHHTKNPAGMTLARLNAIQLLRIYGRHFGSSKDVNEAHHKDQPVWSGHFYNGQQVFWGYHWLVREDGRKEHILKDEYIGWHAGNWDVNTRSIGICTDDDLSEAQPSETVLHAVASIINEHYSNVTTDTIVGHRDVNKRTACPGDLFHSEWR